MKKAYLFGNQNYQNWKQLKNPHNDINLIRNELDKLGFVIESFYDLNYSDMRDQIGKIKYLGVDPQSTCLFYYAGHGFENNGDNYLVPCDAGFESEDKNDCINISDFVKTMGANEKTKVIVVLDCCRSYSNHNDHSDILKDQIKNISVNEETYIIFSTSSGYGALDCAMGANNSVFAKAFIEALKEKELNIEQLSKLVRRKVLLYSGKYNKRQLTWDYSSLTEEVIFNVNIDKLFNEFNKLYDVKNMRLKNIKNVVEEYCINKTGLEVDLFLQKILEMREV